MNIVVELCFANEAFRELMKSNPDRAKALQDVLSMKVVTHNTLTVTDIAVMRLYIEKVLSDVCKSISSSSLADIDMLIGRVIRGHDNALIKQANEVESLKMEPNCDYTCKSCKKKKIFYHSVQTRSADEAATLFYVCLACGYTWTTGL